MKCLIIAAGRGSRLATRGDSKPLVSFLGLTLIERAILTASEAGLDDFHVVTGYNGAKVRNFLDGFSRRRNIRITHIENEEWEKGNGLSVLKAKELLKENFVLLMGDHVFDGSMLQRLKDEKVAGDEVMLAVDRNIEANDLVDAGDVTKVMVEDRGISDIGKGIKRYNAYDTGIFLCSPAIFGAIEECLKRGDSSLSGGIRLLAEKGKAKAFDIRDGYWIDVDDERAYKKAERRLGETLKKASDGPVSRYLNRPVSLRITRYLLKTNITPNQVSVFSFVLSMVGTLFFFLGGYPNLVIGGVLAQASSVIDGCDGEIARLKCQSTEFGGWFDAVLDRYADAFLLFGLTGHVYFVDKSSWALLIGFLAIIGAFMNSYTADKYDGLMKRRLKGHYFRMGRDVRVFIIFLGALINQPLLTLAAIALLMNTESIRRVAVMYRAVFLFRG